jgi:hypothetical protein
MELNIICQKYMSTENSETVSSFIINYNSNKYIISVHHYLPINRIINNDTKRELNIITNSSWSDILILSVENIDLNKYNIIKNFIIKFPAVGTQMTLINSKRYNLVVSGYTFYAYDNLNIEYKLPYIKASIDGALGELYGLSGSPVVINGKLVGIFAKYNCKENVALIIPTYVLIRNLIKKDNTNIYKFPVSPIKKVNNFNVKQIINKELNITEKYIYHSKLKIDVPLNTYLLLEGDVDTQIAVDFENIKFIINEELVNENNIIVKNRRYKINVRLLSLLQKIYDVSIIKHIFLQITNKQTENKELWLTCKKNNITVM